MNYSKCILFILLIFASCSSDSYNKKALQRVLSDFDRHSYYIGLTVRSGSSTSTYVVENSDLYSYYREKDGLTEKSYARRMKSVISNNKVVEIDSTDLKEYGFLRVYPSSTVAADMEGDTSLILSKYFERPTSTYLINTTVDADLWNEIIYTLFKKGVFTKTEDESGMLYVPNEQFEK